MKPKRRYERYKIDFMGISGKMVLAKYVKIIDISIGGICLETEKRLSVGSQYTIKLEGKEKDLTVRGAVVWSLLKESIKDSTGDIIPIYTAGMKFTDVTEKKINQIADFIENHRRDIDRQINMYSSNGRRLFMRIRIEEPEKAVLDYDYRVKNLSLGGMLVESEHSMEIGSRLPMEMILSEGRTIKFYGRVAFCRHLQNGETEHYNVGIDFMEVAEKDKEMLNEFIGSLKKMDKGS